MLNIFSCVYFSYTIFFGEASVQIFCQFLWCIACFLIVLWELLYILGTSILKVRYIICRGTQFYANIILLQNFEDILQFSGFHCCYWKVWYILSLIALRVSLCLWYSAISFWYILSWNSFLKILFKTLLWGYVDSHIHNF